MLQLQEIRPKQKRFVIEFNGTKEQALEIVERFDTSEYGNRQRKLYITNGGKLFYCDTQYSKGEFHVMKGDFIEVEEEYYGECISSGPFRSSSVIDLHYKDEFNNRFTIIKG